MERQKLDITIFILAIALIGFALPAQIMAASQTLEFETQGLDLDTGTVVENVQIQEDETNVKDFSFTYNADVIPHAVRFTASERVEMVFLDNINFDSVTADSIIGMSFMVDVVDQPLGQNDTIVLRTDTGSIFKLGNAIEYKATATIIYEQL